MMNKIIIIVLSLIVLGFNTISVDKLIPSKGQVIELEVIDYGKKVTNNSKFVSRNKGQRTKEALEHNAKILEGKLKGDRKIVTYTVGKSEKNDNYGWADLNTDVNGTTYTSNMAFFNDTLYLTRLDKPFISKDAEGNISAFSLLGVEKIPFPLKVSAVLPPYEDMGAAMPQFSTYSVQKKELISISFSMPYMDYMGRTCRDVRSTYRTTSVDVRKTMSPYYHAIHNVEAEIAAIEKVEFNGKSYDAYLIESMTWSKLGNEVSFETTDAKILKKQIKNEAKVQRLMDRAMGTNDLGYLQLFVQKWFVPELGNVKTINFDHNGVILTVCNLKSIK